MPDVPESHKDLLQAPVAVLATNGRDGHPQVSAHPWKFARRPK